MIPFILNIILFPTATCSVLDLNAFEAEQRPAAHHTKILYAFAYSLARFSERLTDMLSAIQTVSNTSCEAVIQSTIAIQLLWLDIWVRQHDLAVI